MERSNAACRASIIKEYGRRYSMSCEKLMNANHQWLRICPCVLLSELNDQGIVAVFYPQPTNVPRP